MKNLQVNNAIIFDFDGVVLASHLVKTQAFYYVFKFYGNKLALKSQKLHLDNTGVSRLRKFKYILKIFYLKSICFISWIEKNILYGLLLKNIRILNNEN